MNSPWQGRLDQHCLGFSLMSPRMGSHAVGKTCFCGMVYDWDLWLLVRIIPQTLHLGLAFSILSNFKRKLSTSDAKMEAWSYSTNLPERSVLFPMIICKIIIINDHCEMMIINDYLRDSPWSHLDLRVSPPPPASLSS